MNFLNKAPRRYLTPMALQQKLDDRLEAVLDGLAHLGKTWTPEERSRYCDEQGDHPLFAAPGAAPTPATAAMAHVEYDELDSPLVLASECKEQGNAAFKAGAKFHGNAVRHYRDALRHAGVAAASAEAAGGGGGGGEEEVADGVVSTRALRQLVSTCHCNLAAVFLARQKYISVLEECSAALRAWPDNAKAAFRAVKAALALGRATAALELAELGSLAGGGEGEGGGAAVFAPLIREARELLERQARMAAATAAELGERAASLARLRGACSERGISVGPALFNGMRRTLAMPYLDPQGCLHFPIVVLYPAVGQSDFLEDFSEVDTLGELLRTVLPEAPGPGGGAAQPQRAPWDERGEYFASQCDLFYKSNPCKPVAMEEAWTEGLVGEAPEESWGDVRWVLCPPHAPLLLALVQPSYVVADLPVFYVVPRGSAFHAEMRRSAGGSFAVLQVPQALQQALEAEA
jgi:hypothetical protein